MKRRSLASRQQHRPLIGVTTSEVRAAERVTPLPEGEPTGREMALGMPYLKGLEEAGGLERSGLRSELDDVTAEVRSEMLGAVAAEFDAVHSIERAEAVGAMDRIIAAADLRAELVAAVERGMARTAAR